MITSLIASILMMTGGGEGLLAQEDYSKDKGYGTTGYRPGWGLYTDPIEFQGISVQANLFTFPGAEMDVDNSEDSGLDSFSRPTTVSVDHEEKDYDGFGLGAELDFGSIYALIEITAGSWDGEAEVTTTIQAVGTTTGTADTKGDHLGAGVGLGWDGFGYRSDGTQIGIGPEAGVRFIQEELDDVSGAPIDVSDDINEVVGYAALVLNGQFKIGRMDFVVKGKVQYLFGDLQGVGYGLSLGLRWTF